MPIVDRYDLRTIVICQEGYTSSLAAVSLQELGLLNATDIIGGFRAWKEAGLPLTIPDQSSLLVMIYLRALLYRHDVQTRKYRVRCVRGFELCTCTVC